MNIHNHTVVRIGTLTSQGKMNHILNGIETVCGQASDKGTGYIKKQRAGTLKHYPVHCKKCLKLITLDTTKTDEQFQATELEIKNSLSMFGDERKAYNEILFAEFNESGVLV
jgi:hypothetical protein